MCCYIGLCESCTLEGKWGNLIRGGWCGERVRESRLCTGLRVFAGWLEGGGGEQERGSILDGCVV